jgi:hypothetical protein
MTLFYICSRHSTRFSEAFVGLQIRKLTKDKTFDSVLNERDLAVWTAFEDVCSNFLRNNKAENYHEIAEGLIQSYEATGSSMSLKINFYTHIWISSHKISVRLVMNMDSVFIKTLLLWKNHTKGRGALICNYDTDSYMNKDCILNLVLFF